jgi:signal transduction histidine kinase
VRDKPDPDPDSLTDDDDALPDKLAGLTSLRDTIRDMPSPLARPASRKRAHTPDGASETKAHTRRPSRPHAPAVVTDTALADAIAERDKARRMVAAREGILQVVAHDLRNPLNLVKVGGSLLKRMVRATSDRTRAPEARVIDPGKVQEVADTLVIAVARMERLISDLLDLEALDKGQLRLVRGPANANQIVEEVVDEMRPRAEDKGIELVMEPPRHDVIIDCDKDRIAQILENLISNALRFTPKDKRITVRLTDSGGEARFEVADQGPGISDEDLRRIFDPYFRAEVPQGRGLGLGLSICLGLVRAHDGALWAESATGQGATFVFTMPRRGAARDTMVEMPAIKVPPKQR